MRNKTCRRVTVRLYNPEIIEVIDKVPKGLRSVFVQSALVAYMDSGNHRTFIKDLSSADRLMPEKRGPGQGKRDVFTQLVGDF